MKSVGSSASGVRHASRSARRAECPRDVMTTPPARRRRHGCACARSRRGTRRRASARRPGRARSRSSALSSAGVPSRTISPPSMIASRSHSASASSRYCVVRKTVVPRSLMRRTSSQTVSAARGVEARRRLVEEEDLGLVHERGGEVQPALHAAGVALDQAVRGVLELDELEQLLARGPARRPRHAEQPALQDEQLAAGLAAGPGPPPAARRRSGGARRPGSRATSTPATVGAPEVIVSSVVSIRTVVDLPAPFGPRNPKTSPAADPQVDARGPPRPRPTGCCSASPVLPRARRPRRRS